MTSQEKLAKLLGEKDGYVLSGGVPDFIGSKEVVTCRMIPKPLDELIEIIGERLQEETRRADDALEKVKYWEGKLEIARAYPATQMGTWILRCDLAAWKKDCQKETERADKETRRADENEAYLIDFLSDVQDTILTYDQECIDAMYLDIAIFLRKVWGDKEKQDAN